MSNTPTSTLASSWPASSWVKRQGTRRLSSTPPPRGDMPCKCSWVKNQERQEWPCPSESHSILCQCIRVKDHKRQAWPCPARFDINSFKIKIENMEKKYKLPSKQECEKRKKEIIEFITNTAAVKWITHQYPRICGVQQFQKHFLFPSVMSLLLSAPVSFRSHDRCRLRLPKLPILLPRLVP